MKNSIKKGMGLVIGIKLGCMLADFVHEEIMKWGARDEEFMAWEKEHNPRQYEKLKKYQ